MTPPGRDTNPSQVSSQQTLVLNYLPWKDGQLSWLRRKRRSHKYSNLGRAEDRTGDLVVEKPRSYQLRQPCPPKKKARETERYMEKDSGEGVNFVWLEECGRSCTRSEEWRNLVSALRDTGTMRMTILWAVFSVNSSHLFRLTYPSTYTLLEKLWVLDLTFQLTRLWVKEVWNIPVNNHHLAVKLGLDHLIIFLPRFKTFVQPSFSPKQTHLSSFQGS